MTVSVLGIIGGSPTLLASNLSTATASLLSNRVLMLNLVTGDAERVSGQELTVVLTYDDAGAAQSDPYQFVAVGARTAEEAATQAQALIAANPSYFWSSVYAGYLTTDGRRTAPYVVLLAYCADATNGLANWLAGGTTGGGGGGGAPSGPAGGDLAGTYPNPTVRRGTSSISGTLTNGVSTVMDSVAVATYGACAWEIELVKGTQRYASQIHGTTDGATANFIEDGIVLGPGLATLPVVFSVDVSGALLRLNATASAAGWDYRVWRVQLAA